MALNIIGRRAYVKAPVERLQDLLEQSGRPFEDFADWLSVDARFVRAALQGKEDLSQSFIESAAAYIRALRYPKH